MNKQYILKKNYEIEKLIQHKKSVGNKYYAAYFYKVDEIKPHIAISISKKCGNAIVRNYQKRVTKEIIRQNIKQLTHFEVLFVIKKNSLNLSFQEKKDQIQYIIRMIKKKGEIHEET